MMVRPPFTVEVEGIGEFKFRHSAFIDQLRIEARARRILGGDCDDQELRGWAMMVARLETLTEEAPAGWDLANMDPAADDTISRILLVHGRLRKEQERFRTGSTPDGVPAGEGAGGDAGVSVPAPLQPPAG